MKVGPIQSFVFAVLYWPLKVSKKWWYSSRCATAVFDIALLKFSLLRRREGSEIGENRKNLSER